MSTGLQGNARGIFMSKGDKVETLVFLIMPRERDF